MAERTKAHAWRACGQQPCLVGSNPTPSVTSSSFCLVDRCLLTGASILRILAVSIVIARIVPERWQNGNAPVSKTGALTGLGVRIPPSPFSPPRSSLMNASTLMDPLKDPLNPECASGTASSLWTQGDWCRKP